MATNRSNTPLKSPGSPKGLGFFNQFVRHFIRPYGEADDAPSEETVIRRIKPFNCEWLIRPKVAVSETAATILENAKLFDENGSEYSDILNEKFLQAFAEKFSSIQDDLKLLKKDSDEKPTKDNVIALLKFLYKEDAELDKIVDSIFKYGGALFAMSCNIIVARTLIRNHESYAGLVAAENQSDADFKRKKDIKEMKKFLTQNIVGETTKKDVITQQGKDLKACLTRTKTKKKINHQERKTKKVRARKMTYKNISKNIV